MQKQNRINPEMVRLGRELRGYVIIDLSDEIGISRSYMSKLENEKQDVHPDIVDSLSRALNLPPSFFFQEGEILPSNLSYRRREKVSAKDLSRVSANINFYRLALAKLVKSNFFEFGVVSKFANSKKWEPQEFARHLKKEWGVDKGAIRNMVELLEKNKIPVMSFDFETDRIDGKSIFMEGNHPIIFINKRLLGDRQRFTLAYQLGHLLMHTDVENIFERDIIHEANLFAAEFLMPEKEIKKEFENGVTIQQLAKLKKEWKVSMISILYRAHDLAILTDNQKRYLEQQFNELKIRRREPTELDVQTETPALLRNLVTQYKSKKKMSLKDTAEFFNLYEQEFLERYSQ